MKGKFWNWLLVFVAFFVILFIASAMSTDEYATQLDFSSLAWIWWSLLAFAAIYVIYYLTQDNEGWEVGTRQVVYMAIGAALYGIFNWLFNGSTIALPSISLISYRPSMAILVLFGYIFGPVVGFFTGAVGNILGDFLSGWGVFPTWDIGNGLIGFVAGLAMIYTNKERIKTITWVSGIVAILGAVVVLMNPVVPHPWTGEPTSFALMGWVLLVGGIIALATQFLSGMLGEEAAYMNMWGILGIVVGIGYAAIGDIWISGYTFIVTMVGQFAPAAGSNIIFAVILAPILLAAYKAIQVRAGR